ncbi:IS3 family transposase [Micromonospora sp. KC723]|uniref:IS3 family transposase n=1 Tax=Micromonospora sp. KC723 TaxID=2530381 RepID=UPI00104FAE7F|nr:IS3 family transposase [Micromonospora sp. KC723]TDB69409.1 IS3 family transposase [Micromonospora sp. KC723]
MPKAFPLEFRRDVVAVARKGEAPIAQVAKDFGISEACLHRWLKLADVEDGVRPGSTSSESAELRELRRRNKVLEQENEILRRAAAYFAKEIFPKMMYPLVGDLAAGGIPVAVTCRVLGFSKQAYYAWKNSPVSQRDWDEAHLIDAALDIHADDPAFGYRFIADELPAHGITAGVNRVARLCSAQRIWSVFAKRKGLTRRAGPPVHDDLVRRRFTADAPNRVWLTDITEHPTAEGKLYLCAIKDVYSNRIVGYSIDTRMKASLAVSALRNAIRLRNPAGTVVHSDRGSQFRSKKFVKALRCNGLTGSMGRVGACGDNAAMESFFALLQRNVLDRQRWQTRQDLRLAMVTWIERTYHRRRRQRRLGKLTPIKFETINRPAHAA